MTSSKVVSRSSYRRSVWKNGLGHTDEIAIHPEGASLKAGDFLWRLSSARIEQSSPFSPFPEHDRILVVLKGAGLALTHEFEPGEDGERVDVPLLSPYEFPGDVPSRCELISGPITDLSVFVRKAEVDAMATVEEIASGDPFPWVPEGRWNFVFAADGDFAISGPGIATAARISEGDTFRLELDSPASDENPLEIRLTGPGRVPDGKIVLVTLLPSGA